MPGNKKSIPIEAMKKGKVQPYIDADDVTGLYLNNLTVGDFMALSLNREFGNEL